MEVSKWFEEKSFIWRLIYFVCLILFYNLTILVYSSLLYKYGDDSDHLAAVIPVLACFQVFICINFTFRYYRIARAMRIFFTSDLQNHFKYN